MVATTGEGRAGATGPGEAVVAGVLGAVEVRGRSATTRPVAASPATTTSARIAATHRRLGAVRRRPPAMAGAAGTVTSVPAARPSPSASSDGAPAPPGITRSGGAAPPGTTRSGRKGRTTPPVPRWPRWAALPGRPRLPARTALAVRISLRGLVPVGGGPLAGLVAVVRRVCWEVTGAGGHGPRGSRGGAARRRLAGLVARPCGSPSRAGQASSSSWRRIRDTASPSPTVRITESSRSSPAIPRP